MGCDWTKNTVGLNFRIRWYFTSWYSSKIKAKLIAKLTGTTIKEVYQKLLDKIEKW